MTSCQPPHILFIVADDYGKTFEIKETNSLKHDINKPVLNLYFRFNFEF